MGKSFRDHGISSMQLIGLVSELSRACGVSLPPTLGFDHPTPRLLAEAVSGLGPGQQSRQIAKPPCSTPVPTTHDRAPILSRRTPDTAQQPVAVIGMWCRFPGGSNNPDAFWDLLQSGRDAIEKIPNTRFDADSLLSRGSLAPGMIASDQGGFVDDVEAFDAAFFGISPREAALVDPQQRLLLEVAWHALEQAGINPDSLRRSKTGVFIGASGSDYGRLLFSDPQNLNLFGGTGCATSILANRISYVLGSQGPSLTIDTACSSSLVAVHTACRNLQTGDADLALAGGVNLILSPEMTIIFSQAGLMAPDGRCKVFDKTANGYVRSEGCGVLVLKRLDDARRDGDRIWGVILSSVVNQDGQSNGLTVPNGEAQQALLAEALAKAGIRAGEMDYLEAHGTGTPVGDPIEVAAAGAVLGGKRETPLLMGSVKSNIGHLEQAAGVAGLIKVLLSFAHGELPPNLHFSSPNPLIDLNSVSIRVPTSPTPWPAKADRPRIAGVSGFSFGGTNAHVIVSDPPLPRHVETEPGTNAVLCLGARTEEALRQMAVAYVAWLDRHPKIPMPALCREAAAGRGRFPFRLAVTGSKPSDLGEKLGAFLDGRIETDVFAGSGASQPRTAFLFTGQGSQYGGMGRELYAACPVFRDILDHCDGLLRSGLEHSLLDVIFDSRRDPSPLHETAYTQPALFALEYALAQQMEAWGVRPDFVMGHSVGEFAAACHAGLFSLEDGLRLVAARGRLIQSLPAGGGMAAVFADEATAGRVLSRWPQLSIAAVNGPENVVLSGPEDMLTQALEDLATQDIHHARLTVSHAFHSAQMEPILDPFDAVAHTVTFNHPTIPVISNVTGQPVSAETLSSPAYWRKHLRSHVRFLDGVRALEREGVELFVEVGPHPVLSGMGRSCLENPQRAIFAPALRRGAQDGATLARCLATIHAAGGTVDWPAYYKGVPLGDTPLPVYPFRRTRYWLDRDAVSSSNRLSATISPVLPEDAVETVSDTTASPSQNFREQLRNTTDAEEQVRSLTGHIAALAATILDLPGANAATFDRPLIRMGLDSLLAVQLKAKVDAALGTAIPLAAFLADHSLPDLARDILRQIPQNEPESDQPQAAIPHDAANRHAPFALTDVQHAYWTGRQPDMELGGVGCQVYAEVDVDALDISRLEAAINTLVSRHDMLRAVVDTDGSQCVLADPGPYHILVEDLQQTGEEDRDRRLQATRRELSTQCRDTAVWPLFDVRVSQTSAGTSRVHVVFDMLIGDGMSFLLLLDELETLYNDPGADLPSLGITFRDCLLAQSDPARDHARQRAHAYWWKRLEDLPSGPKLTIRPAATATKPRFARLRGALPRAAWAALREKASRHGLTPSSALLAAFGEVLAAWSTSQRFSLNLTMFNRPALHPDISRIVGDFTTLLLLEAHIGNRPFAENAMLTQQQLWRDMEHRDVSAIEVLREMRRINRHDGTESVPVVFTSLLPLTGSRGRGGFAPNLPNARVAHCISSTPQVWLDHQVYEEQGELRFNWDYVEGLFPEGMLEAMFEAYQQLLHSLADTDKAWQTPTGDLAPTDHLETIQAINSRHGDVPPMTLHGLFERSARAVPQRPAVVAGNVRLDYGQLDAMANRVARGLAADGVAPGEVVGIVMPKGWEQVVAVLGILKAGATYLPIEADTPVDRLALLLGKARARMVLTPASLANTTDWPETVRPATLEELAERDHEDQALPEITPDNRAYVIFTSGSTGLPKGVVQDHASVVNTVLDINRRLALEPSDAVFGVSNLAFDLSVYDIFGPLAAGASLVLPAADMTREPQHWIERMADGQVTVWNSAPALLQMLLHTLDGQTGAAPGRLRHIMLSGDWIPVDLVRETRKRFPSARIMSLGGATEAAIWSICHPVATLDAAETTIPYGKPMTNQQLLVLDERLRVCPPWVTGHLYIGGRGLALEYLDDPERTGQSFIRHPETGQRLYRTGDLGRYRPDGVIEFAGRLDFQIKIRGHRIELGEIEHTLKQHPAVRDAVVTVSGEADKGRRLTAFVVGGRDVDLPAYLHEKLPSFMVPAQWVWLEAFPLTPSGKVDRKALAAPEGPTSTAAEPPATPEEAALLALWREILDNATLGVTDDFFEAGGDSLLATRIITAVRKQLGATLTLNALFGSPTVRELAYTMPLCGNKADAPENTLPRIVPAPQDRQSPFDLTDIQHAYWMGRNAAYELGNVAAHFYYEIENTGLDAHRLERAWQRVVDRHDMLRAVILPDGRQQVLGTVPAYTFAHNDYRDLDAAALQQRLDDIRETMSNQQLDPGVWPLFDIRVSELPEGRTRVHIDIDNLIADAWSLFTFLKEWDAFYHDPDQILPPVPLAFRDYVLTQKAIRETAAYKRDRAYWLQRIESLPPAPELPLAREPGSIDKPRFSRLSHRLAVDTWKRLSAKASAAGLTASSVLITAYAEVLAKWSANPRFTINVTLFNRLPLHPDVDAVVGDFTSLNLLEVDRTNNAPLPEKARQDQSRLWQDMDHRLFGGVSVMREIALARNTPSHAVMPVVFTSALLGSVGHDASVLASFGELTYSIFQTPQVWLDHQVYEDKGELVLNWDYVAGLFPDGLPEAMFTAYTTLLAAMAERDDWNDLGVVLPREQAARIHALNDTAAPVPAVTLPGLFMAQVARQPDAPAIFRGATMLTYGELEQRSARVAAAVTAAGARPGDPVAVVLARGVHQVEAVMGIVRSAAAYLPMVPPLPPKRMRTILDDAGAKVVLTSSALAESLDWPAGITVLSLEQALNTPPVSPLPPVAPEALAYIIYTSGSTGTPKGVAISHQSAANTLADINDRFNVRPGDRVLAVSGLGFDLSVYDIFGTLAAGAAIVMPEGETNDPADWLAAMERHGATIWNSAPALLEMLVTHVAGTTRRIPSSLRLVLASGDRIPLDLPRRLSNLAPQARMISLGGATEASVWSVLHPVGETSLSGWNSIPYGRPMRAQQLHVLDNALAERPEWVPGDLYIAGAGLALGYWNDPEKTRQSFITHPETGQRLYRTGDLARYRPEGTLEFLGRSDHQIKLRGHRVEPGEIESAVCGYPGVEAALVVLAESGTGERLLAAYVATPRPEALDQAALRAYLAERLPGFMIPAAITALDALPVTANGKIDRAALPRPEVRSAPATPAMPGEADPAAAALTEVIREFLETTEVDVDANFFELGLTSFHLVQIQAKMRETLGREIPVADFFLHPTPRLLATAVSQTPSP